jgi:hypothetical protein
MQLELYCTKGNRIMQCLQRLRLINRREVFTSNRVAPTNLKLVFCPLPAAGDSNVPWFSLHPSNQVGFASKLAHPDAHCRSLLSVEIYQ